MQKTIGGDRLGAGKKMQVNLHGYERSTHDLSYVWRSTMSAGTLVPFMSQVALPGDTFDIDLDCDVKTHPTLGPLFGSYKVQLDLFLTPIRLYNAQLHNNTLGIGKDMSQVKLPTITLTAAKFDAGATEDIDNSQINPSCILAYLGLRGVGIQIMGDIGVEIPRGFNAIPLLTYWDIYKYYYANKQEENGAVIHSPQTALVPSVTSVGIKHTTLTIEIVTPLPTTTAVWLRPTDIIRVNFTGGLPLAEQIMLQTTTGNYTIQQLITPAPLSTTTIVGELEAPYNGQFGQLVVTGWRYINANEAILVPPQVSLFLLEDIDAMRKAILTQWDNTNFIINGADLEPYKLVYQSSALIPNRLSSQEGLAIKTYQSDLFNNWVKTENIDAINTATAVDTSGGSFNIESLILSRKLYAMLMRINISGGTYDDWLDAVYANDKYRTCESPMYMGGLIKELVFQEVVSNSDSGDQPLGTLAGKGVMANKHKGGKVVIKVDEPSYIMGIISLTPRIDYSQGNSWDMTLQTMDDFHKPALDEIGFQELITEQMAWWDTYWDGTNWVQRSAGKQPAWLNYMTNVNRCYGNFAVPVGGTGGGEMFMTLNRRYEQNNADLGDPISIADLTTYIDPAKYNFIFAETALDAQNFWTQIAVNITARRKMSHKLMPNL